MYGASLDDLDLLLFQREYLQASIAPEVLEMNERSEKLQLASLRFVTAVEPQPTGVGVMTVGKDPRQFFPGAYVQFLRIAGAALGDPILDQKDVSGPLPDLVRRLDEVLTVNISVATDITSSPSEIRQPDYPLPALQQISRNAIMHRSYAGTNAPVRITWFSDRVEMLSPGGPYGIVTLSNFGTPGITDYRNPHLAEAMHNLGFVQKFGLGIATARRELEKNGNPPLELQPTDTAVLAILRRRP